MLTLRAIKRTMDVAKVVSPRMASTSSSSEVDKSSRYHGIDLANFDPNNYNIPVRPETMDDLMEPYGPYKQAYAAEKRRGNIQILKGSVSLIASFLFLYFSGAMEGLFMPNLDNIMEETEPFNFDTEGRVSVVRD